MNKTPTHVLVVTTGRYKEYVLPGTSLADPAFDSSNSTVGIAVVPQWFADEVALVGPLMYDVSDEELAEYIAAVEAL
jgi:hypothetical protein